MEIAVGEYEVDFPKMMGAAVKKYYEERDLHDLERLRVATESIIRSTINVNCDNSKSVTVFQFADAKNDLTAPETGETFHMDNLTESASLLMQFLVLFGRYFKASSRNKVSHHRRRKISNRKTKSRIVCFQFLIIARIVAHMFIAPIFGYLYKDVGPNPASALGNYVYLYGSILLIVYTGKMSVVLSCKYFAYNVPVIAMKTNGKPPLFGFQFHSKWRF